MKNSVENFLKKKNLLNPDNMFVIAFSGGYDSMCLADIMINLSKIYRFKIVLAHLNHNWRGEISDNEEQNCKEFAKQKNVIFYTEKLDKNLPHTETVAREERYKFFLRVANKYYTNTIFTAHTKSDNIETVLQRIIKGTGISGLKGIDDERIIEDKKILRPLLDFSRSEILMYCKTNNLNPNNDNSNTDTRYFRNRIRENLIPELKANYDKNIENAIIRLIQNAKDEEEIVDNTYEQIIKNVFSGETIKTKEFTNLSLPFKKRIIKNFLAENDFDYTQKRILEILEFIADTSLLKSGKTFSITKGKWLYVNDKSIALLDKDDYNNVFAQTEVNMYGETYLKEFDAIIKVTKWNETAPDTFPKENENIVYADLSNIDTPLSFRTRIFGDIIVPFGKHSPIKLKKYLNNKKLSKHDKSKVLLISSPKEVLWVINWGISNNIKVTNMPTHKIEFYKRSKNE